MIKCQCFGVPDVNIYRAGNNQKYLTKNSYYIINVLGLNYTRSINNLGICLGLYFMKEKYFIKPVPEIQIIFLWVLKGIFSLKWFWYVPTTYGSVEK